MSKRFDLRDHMGIWSEWNRRYLMEGTEDAQRYLGQEVARFYGVSEEEAIASREREQEAISNRHNYVPGMAVLDLPEDKTPEEVVQLRLEVGERVADVLAYGKLGREWFEDAFGKYPSNPRIPGYDTYTLNQDELELYEQAKRLGVLFVPQGAGWLECPLVQVWHFYSDILGRDTIMVLDTGEVLGCILYRMPHRTRLLEGVYREFREAFDEQNKKGYPKAEVEFELDLLTAMSRGLVMAGKLKRGELEKRLVMGSISDVVGVVTQERGKDASNG